MKKDNSKGTNSRARRLSRRIIIALAALLTIFLIIPTAISGVMYERIFDRYETRPSDHKDISDYDGLMVENVRFISAQGNYLAGYIYTDKDTDSCDGVVILAHGLFGGGHNSYMDVIDYFTDNGFIVFAYDATGNDESGGRSVRGIPQGISDLDTAIHYVEDEMDGYPICLWGHSWGAYSADAVLNYHPEIKAVVSCSGFNRSLDMLENWGRAYAGDIAGFSLFYVNLYEHLKFGKYSSASAIGGFENSDALVMVIHSDDDPAVPFERGYGSYYEKFGGNDRFTFRRYNNRGHRAYYTGSDDPILDKELFQSMTAIYREAIRSR